MTDSGSVDYQVKTFQPYLIAVAQIGMLVTFFNCLQEIGELLLTSAFMVALLSVFPLWFAVLSGNLIAEFAFPGTLNSLSRGFPGIEVVQNVYNYLEPHRFSSGSR